MKKQEHLIYSEKIHIMLEIKRTKNCTLDKLNKVKLLQNNPKLFKKLIKQETIRLKKILAISILN